MRRIPVVLIVVVAAGAAAATAAQARISSRDARAAARCLERLASDRAGAVTVRDGLLEPEARWACMPRALERLEVPAPRDARRLASCFTRLADERDASAASRLAEACAALADALEDPTDAARQEGSELAEPRSASGVRVVVARALREHRTRSETELHDAVLAREAELGACRAQGTGVVQLHLRASRGSGDAVVLELSAGATVALGRCVADVAGTVRTDRDAASSAVLAIEIAPAGA